MGGACRHIECVPFTAVQMPVMNLVVAPLHCMSWVAVVVCGLFMQMGLQ